MRNSLTPYQSIINLPNIIDQVLKIVLFTTLILGIVWSRDGIGIGGTVLFSITVVCIILIAVNNLGFSTTAGGLLLLVLLLGVTVLAIREDGYYNVPALAYPILTVISGLFFGKKYIPAFTMLTLVILMAFNFLEKIGVINPFEGLVSYYDGDFVTAFILQSATGIVLLLLLVIFESNVDNIIRSEGALQETYDLTLQGWAKSLELRGYDPPDHHNQIKELAKQFGDYLGLEKQKQEALFYGALLHDIGKIGISDRILLKPGSLTEEEFEQIKQHPLIGNEILMEVPELGEVREIVLYHHEQWDGQGYPEQLEKENIPYQARIFAVLDNWVSLTKDVPYRKAWTKDSALEYINQQAGKKFDPQIVEQFSEFITKIDA